MFKIPPSREWVTAAVTAEEDFDVLIGSQSLVAIDSPGLSRATDQNQEQPKPVLFISYASRRKKSDNWLLRHIDTLLHLGYMQVFDESHFDVGEHWYSDLKDLIRQASFVLCVVDEPWLS